MEYFLVSPHPDYIDAPQLRNINDLLNSNHFYYDQSYDMPMRTVIQLHPNEHMDFTDYLFQAVPLISKEAMTVIWRFDDDYVQKEIILFDQKNGLDKLYYLPFFPRFPRSVVAEPKNIISIGTPDVIPELTIPYTLPVFYVVWEVKCLLFMRLDVVESLLRNGVRGILLREANVSVREG